MWQCDKCNEYRFNDSKICHCKEFNVIDLDGDNFKIRAMYDQDAALKFAQESNENNEYYLMDSNVEIKVNGKSFSISAEPDVHYSASEI